VFNGPEVDIGH